MVIENSFLLLCYPFHRRGWDKWPFVDLRENYLERESLNPNVFIFSLSFSLYQLQNMTQEITEKKQISSLFRSNPLV